MSTQDFIEDILDILYDEAVQAVSLGEKKAAVAKAKQLLEGADKMDDKVMAKFSLIERTLALSDMGRANTLIEQLMDLLDDKYP